MIGFLRTKKLIRPIAAFFLLNILAEIVLPTAAYALTGGPSQPEVESFEPIGTSEMVDAFSGDFNYNIPLMDVGGYPINISYHSGITMDQEASWVGLGWNINPGVINRNMRGVPDDFHGDGIKKEFNTKANETYGIKFPFGFELFSLGNLTGSLSLGLGLSYNTYNGMGFEMSIDPSVTAAKSNNTELTMGLGFSASSESGVGISPSVSFAYKTKEKDNRETKSTIGLGLSFNSRAGLQALSLSKSVSVDKRLSPSETDNRMSYSNSSSISYSSPAYTPQINMPMNNTSLSMSATIGTEIFGAHGNVRTSCYYSGQRLAEQEQTLPAYGYMNLDAGTQVAEMVLDFNREKDGSYTQHTPNLPITQLTHDIYSVSGQGVGGMYRPYRSDIGYVYDSRVTNTTSDVNFPGIEIGGGKDVKIGTNASGNYGNSVSGNWSATGSELTPFQPGGMINSVFNPVSENAAASYYYYKKSVGGNPLYEPYYFKQVGEKAADPEPELFTSIGGFAPVKVKLSGGHSPSGGYQLPVLESPESSIPMSTVNYRKKRNRRNEVIMPLTAAEAQVAGLQKNIPMYDFNNFTYSNGKYSTYLPLSRTANNVKGHHISEISVYRNDGARYVYGIPAYNTVQHEVSFALQGNEPNCANGLVEYTPGLDDSYRNSNGLDNFYTRTVMPPFAHSYLLTTILSADYVDRTGNGPTEDDLGTYTCINYSRLYTDGASTADKYNPGKYLYKWRVPFEEGKVNFNEGMKSLDWQSQTSDDKGNYLYGEKELWYVHSIETRTHVAEFSLSNREDARGVAGKAGGFGDTELRMKKLDKISLYAREDKIKTSNPVPIKVVNFEYDYSLCPGVGNNSGVGSNNAGGKLTLKKLYFTYGSSKKGELSPYAFNYAEVPGYSPDGGKFNPSYNLKGYDRWGNFKPNPGDARCDVFTMGSLNDFPLTTSESPYTSQGIIPDEHAMFNGNYPGRSFADIYAAAWSLSSIELPSGGKITIEYEADDYAYVQDKRAMYMASPIGAVSESDFQSQLACQSGPSIDLSSIAKPYLYGDGNMMNSNYTPNPYMLIKLNTPMELTEGLGLGSGYCDPAAILKDDNKFQQAYLRETNGKLMDYLYFKSLVSMELGFSEYVPGYAKIEGGGLVRRNYTIDEGSGKHMAQYAWIKLKLEPQGDKVPKHASWVHPISRTAWNFMKMNLPRMAFRQSDPSKNGMQEVFDALAASFYAIRQMAEGFNDNMLERKCAHAFGPDRTFLRLYHPSYAKQGGGSRVKSIKMNDQWDAITGQVAGTYGNFDYGQEYEYTTELNGKKISSGVAAYEPAVGGEENPFKQPVFFKEEKRMVPSEEHMQETPYGESFFPSPSVGYSRVTVKNLKHENVNKNATGKIVHEFYTAKDFPTLVKKTTITPHRYKPSPILRLLKIENKDYMTVSQGYAIELNDMHGKPRGQKVYAEGQIEPISGIEYKYRVSRQNRLSNKFLTLNKDNMAKESEMIGVEYEMVLDTREQMTTQTSAGISVNLDAFVAGIVPVVVPVILPSYSKESTRFRSVVATKVINRFGILEETIAYDLGSRVSTRNKALDEETGEVLLTETQNQFDDPIYKFTYPAHWVYDKMGPAYKNLGYSSQHSVYNVFTYPLNPAVFSPGDEVMINVYHNSGLATQRAWVVRSSAGATSGACACPNNLPCLKLMDESGNVIKNCFRIMALKLVRSSRRNMQALPVGTVVSLNNPLVPFADNNQLFSLRFTKVIDANAMEYSDEWKIFCECGYTPITENQAFNPYMAGKLGTWRPKRTMVYLTDRTQSKYNQNTNIRKDGAYKTFEPYWLPQGAGRSWIASNPQNRWQFSTEVSIFSPYGFELENKDALGRYSAATYGYNNHLPTAVSANAQYRETAFDGFEDYNFSSCNDDHFSYRLQLIPANTDATISTEASHTGKRAVKIQAGKNVRLRKVIGNNCPPNQ